MYVDTMYDPDLATSHEPPQELSQPDLLRHVLANSGADKSATITIGEEWADSQSITRLLAEYETIARRATEDRYTTLVASSGLTPTQANAVRASEAWGPLMAALRDAESRGLDIDRAVPALVRTVTTADDIAAALHGRVTTWLNAAGGHDQAERIVGLFPATTTSLTPTQRRCSGIAARSSSRTCEHSCWKRSRDATSGPWLVVDRLGSLLYSLGLL